MESEQINKRFNASNNPIKYGSCINLSLSQMNNCFISCEGFLNNKLYVKKFDTTNSLNNFVSTTFKIMPFSYASSFKTQIELLGLAKDFKQKAEEYYEKDLLERKEFIAKMNNEIDNEIHLNFKNYQKMKGTPVLFYASFQLLHVSTMKYLSLNTDSQDNYYFEVVDQCTKYSFFKFIPILKVQKQRNNIVYNQDIVILSTANPINIAANACAGLYTSYGLNIKDRQNKEKKDSKIVATFVENPTTWRVNIYDPEEVEKESMYLKSGDVVWFELSETHDYLSLNLKSDNQFPLKKEQDNIIPQKNVNSSSTSKLLLALKNPDNNNQTISEVYEEQEGKTFDFINTSVSINEKEEKNSYDFLEEIIWANLQVQFQERELKGSINPNEEMTTKGLWRIESVNFHEGGYIMWTGKYKLKHLGTGKYLRTRKTTNSNILDLGTEVDEDGIFKFVPAAKNNRNDTSTNNEYLTKENFFKIQHVQSQQFICSQNTRMNISEMNYQIFKSMMLYRQKTFRVHESDKILSKTPILLYDVSSMDIFKVKRANYEEIWETSFLTSIVLGISELIEYLNPIKISNVEENLALYNKHLHDIMEKMSNIFSYLESFLCNKLATNIATNQEYGEISHDRQKILREQYILALLCSLMIKGFPSHKELCKIAKEKPKFQSPTRKRPFLGNRVSMLLENLDAPQKIEKEFIRLKYDIMAHIYHIIELACYKNHENQIYLFDYIESIIDHLRHGSFVYKTLISIIKDNEKLLYNLNKGANDENNQNLDISLNNNTNNPLENFIGDEKSYNEHSNPPKLSLLSRILNQIKSINLYYKSDILNLLRELCICNYHAIYINQEKIFKYIYQDDNFRTNNLLELKNDKNTLLYVRMHEMDATEILTNKKTEYIELQQYIEIYGSNSNLLMNELDLYSVLCKDRNYKCLKTFNEIFNLCILISYILNNNIPDKYRAIFVTLLINIHIDKYPNTCIKLPNLIRLQDNMTKCYPALINNNILSEEMIHIKSDEGINFSENRYNFALSPLSNEPLINEAKENNKEQQQQQQNLKTININSTKSQDETDKFAELHQFIAKYFANLQQEIYRRASRAKIYTPLTLEILRLVEKMLKFGLFKKGSNMNQSESFGDKEANKYFEPDLENLIKYLAAILEYDAVYFSSMQEIKIKRKCEPVSRQSVISFQGLTGAKGFANELKNFGNLFLVEEIDEVKHDKKDIKKEIDIKNANNMKNNILNSNDLEDEWEQILLKQNGLKKILQKFNNKSCTFVEEDANEIQIKIEICSIFDYILDLRADFLIENIMQYFRNYFTPIKEESALVEEFYSLLPDHMLPIGNNDNIDHKSHKKAKNNINKERYKDNNKNNMKSKVKSKLPPSRFKNYTKYNEIKSFDQILQKSFFETALLGLYFTDNSDLQNAILKLLYRACNETLMLSKNIDILELLHGKVHYELYNNMVNMLNELKNLESTSQIWLQIIDETLYEDIFYESMNRTYDNLLAFEQNIIAFIDNDRELSKLAQRIFAYMDYQDTIIGLLRTGLSIFDKYSDQLISIRSANTSRIYKNNSKAKNSININNSPDDARYKIMIIFKKCYSILSWSCKNNHQNQKNLSNYLNLITQNNDFDIGQIELINDIIKDNPQLATSMSSLVLKYLFEMTKIHGRRAKFLDILSTMITYKNYDNSVLQQKLLYMLLNQKYLEYFDPFNNNQKEKPDKNYEFGFKLDIKSSSYEAKYLKLISTCLDGDIALSLLAKAYDMMSMNEFMDKLQILTKEIHDHYMQIKLISNDDLKEAIESKQSIVIIIKILASSSIKALDDLAKYTKVIAQDLFNRLYSLILIQVIENEGLIIQLILSTDSMLNLILDYIFVHLLDFINFFIERLIIDTSTPNLELEKLDNTDIKAKIKLKRFANLLRNHFNKIIANKDTKETHLRNYLEFCQYFNIPFPEQIAKALNKKIDIEKEPLSKGTILNKSNQRSNYGTSVSHPVYSFSKVSRSTGVLKTSIKAVKNLFGIAKNTLVRSMIKGAGSSSDTNDEKIDLNQKWQYFKECFMIFTRQNKINLDNVHYLGSSIMNFSDIFSSVRDEQKASFFIHHEDIMLKLLEYLEFWKQKKASLSIVRFIIKTLGTIIKTPLDQNNLIETKNRQNIFDKLKATKIIVSLILTEKNDDIEYLDSLFKFCILLLHGGNIIVQNTLYDHFLHNPTSEKFFWKLNNLIIKEINRNETPESIHYADESKLRKRFSITIMRLLQLFCEGHNLKLQNYLRYQIRSKNSYDLINLTARLLCSFKISQDNYKNVLQCFDTLTEFIQGPCKDNQVTIFNTKFLEFAVSILNDEPKVYSYTSDTQKTYENSTTTPMRSSRKKFQISMQLNREATSFYSSTRKNQNILGLPGFQISKIKYKCLTTLVSLLEGRDPMDNLRLRVARIIPLGILKNNLIRVYKLYKELYPNEDYNMNLFGHNVDEKDMDNKKPAKYYEFILENGFNIFILINIFLDQLKNRNELDDNDEFAQFQEKEKIKHKNILHMEIIHELKNLMKSLYQLTIKCKKRHIDVFKDDNYYNNINDEQIKKIEQAKYDKEIIKEAVVFFRQNIKHIEIIRDNHIEKIYFPILPYCKILPKSYKKEFYEKADRSSIKSKINYLMKISDDILKFIEHEGKLTLIFNKYKIIGIIASHGLLWEKCAFYVNLVLNFIIIASYSEYFGDRLKTPRLFLNPKFESTDPIIKLLGLLNLIFSALVVAFTLVKRVPLVVKPIWKGFPSLTIFKKSIKLMVNLLWSLLYCLQDFYFSYYSLFIMVCILGLIIHPFFYTLQLFDLLRNPILKNVVKAVWIPKFTIFLTIIVMLLATYYFAIFGYLFFPQHYDSGNYCITLEQCSLITFDQTFKNNGGLGSYLTDPDYIEANDNEGKFILETNVYNIGRFIYDNLENTIIKLVIVNMVAGIIIDNFGALRQESEDKAKDMTQICYICGIDNETIDKNSEKQNGFQFHVKNDHHLWNYIFYRAYLEYKDPTEYNGAESYVSEKIKNSDFSWFPINRALCINNSDLSQQEKSEIVERITKNMSDIKLNLLTNVNKIQRLVEEIDKL